MERSQTGEIKMNKGNHRRRMTVGEIKAKAYDAIDHLQQAKVGGLNTAERSAHRQEAGAILTALPGHWWRRLTTEDSDRILSVLTDLS